MESVVAVVVSVAWIAGGLAVRRAPRIASWMVAIGAAVAVVAGTSSHRLAGAVAGLAASAVAGLLVSLPDGSVATTGARVLLVLTAAAAAAAGGVVTGPTPVAVTFVVLAGGGTALAADARKYRRASDPDRRRLQLACLGLVLVADIAVVVLALHFFVDRPRGIAVLLGYASLALPIVLAGAWRSERPPRVDRILAAIVFASGVALLLVAILVVVVVALGERPTGRERTVLLLALGATGLALLLSPWAIGRMRALANRLSYGEQTEPIEALRTFGARMTRALPLDELLQQLAELLRRHLRLTSAEVWTGTAHELFLVGAIPHRDAEPIRLGEDEAQVVARAGVSGEAWMQVWLPELFAHDPDSTTRVAPLTHAGELLGLVVCRRPHDGDPFDESEDQVLADVVRQVAVAIHNSQLDSALQASLRELQATNDELRASRSRIVASADAARRRIERDLHDGAQQHLVALAVKLGLARQLLGDDAQTADTLLEELRADVQTTLAELRELAHGIYPPLLRDRGLREALQAACQRAVIPADLDCEDLDRFDPEVEAAVYFCCLEALQNAGKYAGDAAVVRVTVSNHDGSVRFAVADDGAGFAAGNGALGQGFLNMADRLGAIGGTLDVRSAPGSGTRVAGEVPLVSAP